MGCVDQYHGTSNEWEERAFEISGASVPEEIGSRVVAGVFLVLQTLLLAVPIHWHSYAVMHVHFNYLHLDT